jgi:hypothetical protein
MEIDKSKEDGPANKHLNKTHGVRENASENYIQKENA